MPLFNDVVALLRAPVGNNLENRPSDVENVKRNFAAEGRYKRPVENGIIDQELDDAITSFQRDNELKVDGIMNPGGETEATLVSSLMNIPNVKPPSGETNSKIEHASALPGMAMRLFGFGLGTAGAMEWWKSNSTDHRENMVKGLERRQGGRISKEEEARCDELYQRLTNTCRRVREEKGPDAAAICRQEASEVYAACLAGKTLPPFHY